MQDTLPFVRYAAYSRNYIDSVVCGYDCRILYILGGHGRFINHESGECFPLCENTFIYYPAGMRYHIQSDADDELSFYTINFDFDCNASHLQSSMCPVSPSDFNQSLVLNSFASQDSLFWQVVCIRDAECVKNELSGICREHESNLLHKDSFSSAYLKLVLCRILRLKNNIHADDTAFEKTLEYIRSHYNQFLDNKKIAQAVNYHPNYLNTVIRNKTGRSLHRYITEYRISQAVRLLSSTTLSVQSIAEQCGFVNANHFSACFKKRMGTSPLNYKKSIF